MIPTTSPRLTASSGMPRDDGHDVILERKGADAGPRPPLDTEKMRQEILARLLRMHCARVGGCTRRCRRGNRCVEADAVAAGVDSGLKPRGKA